MGKDVKLLMHHLDVVAEDGGKEVGFGAEGEVFDGEVVHAFYHEFETSCVEAHGELGYALGVGAFHGVCHAQEGGEFLKAETIGLAEEGVEVILRCRCAVTVVTGEHADELDIPTGETEDFGVKNNVLTVAVVGFRIDEGADFVQDGGNFEEQTIVAGEMVKFLELVEERDGELAHVTCVSAVDFVAICK